ncbi:acetamidase/formamidase family protein [Bifidobacterium sp.]|uniref:acetamidase/formamidase family protein n=1 Tax=Bifidobacterium sp. TaxID=41200 RepID=UPI003D7DEF3D
MKDSRAFGPVLQRLTPEEARDMGGQYVPASVRNTFWGVLPSRADGPIASISSGQRITIDTISHEGLMPDQGSDPVRYFGSRGIGRDELLEDAIAIPACKSRGEHDGSHVVTGPIEVKGAKPGDVLMVSIDRLERRAPYGVISTRHGRGVMVDSELEGDYGALCKVISVDGTAFGQIVPDGTQFHDQALDGTDYPAFPLHPFLGIMGVTPDSDERKCSIPPYAFGGNIDVNDMTEGSTLFLPVQIDGAGFYIGDPHYAQGDGEVALTALEAPLRATVTLTVIPGEVADGLFGVHDRPFAYAGGKLLALGLHEDLDEALRQSVAYSISLLSSLFHLPKKAIYLYLSAAADFDVSQAVDLVRGIHSRIPLSHFEGPAADDFIGYIMQAVKQGVKQGD